VLARGEEITQFFVVYLMNREAFLILGHRVDNAATLEWTQLLQETTSIMFLFGFLQTEIVETPRKYSSL
jgi:hypothetical protein